MKTRTILIAAVALAASTPVVSNASPEKLSVKACADAFASSIAAPGSTAKRYKLDFRARFSGSIADFYPTEYTYTLEARDPKSGNTIAHAECSADSRGFVTEINVTAVEPQLAAR